MSDMQYWAHRTADEYAQRNCEYGAPETFLEKYRGVYEGILSIMRTERLKDTVIIYAADGKEIVKFEDGEWKPIEASEDSIQDDDKT